MPANGGVSSGNVVDLAIAFRDQPLKSLNNRAFQAMFADVTLTETVALNLKGTAAVSARTTIGDVPISGIPFDVPSALKGTRFLPLLSTNTSDDDFCSLGIHSFGGSASLSNISIAGSGGSGGSEFIVAPLTAALQNPSNISLQTVRIALPVTYKGVMIGRTAIDVSSFHVRI